MPTAGAGSSITFLVLAHPGTDVLTLIEKTPTPLGDPQWTAFP